MVSVSCIFQRVSIHQKSLVLNTPVQASLSDSTAREQCAGRRWRPKGHNKPAFQDCPSAGSVGEMGAVGLGGNSHAQKNSRVELFLSKLVLKNISAAAGVFRWA